MDDDKFKIEILARLDKIVALLSLSCSMSKAALEQSHPELVKPKPAEAEQDGAPTQSRQYLIKDEMQEDYDLAIQRWKAGKG